MGKTIAFTSGKGGVGKTTAAAGVAEALAKRGQKTLALDADIDFGNIDILLGVQASVYTLDDVLSGICSLDDAIYSCDLSPNLFYLSAALSRDNLRELAKGVLSGIMDRLRLLFDYIVIDTAAGIGNSFEYFTKESDIILLVTMPHIAAIRDAQRVTRLLAAEGREKRMKLIVNMVASRMIQKRVAPNIDEIINMTGVPLIGLIPMEKRLAGWQNTGNTPLTVKERTMAIQLEDIAARLCGENQQLKRFW